MWNIAWESLKLFGIKFTNSYVKMDIILSIYDIIHDLQLSYDTTCCKWYLDKRLFVECRVNYNCVKNHFIAFFKFNT